MKNFLVILVSVVCAGVLPAQAKDDKPAELPLNKPGLSATLSCESLEPFVFSPTLYRFDTGKSTPWSAITIQGLDSPVLQFNSGGLRTLSLKFRLSSATDIGPTIRKLAAAAYVTPDLHRPPICVLSIGPFTFRGVVTDFQFSYDDIESNGARRRADVTMSMLHYREASEQLQGPPPE